MIQNSKKVCGPLPVVLSGFKDPYQKLSLHDVGIQLGSNVHVDNSKPLSLGVSGTVNGAIAKKDIEVSSFDSDVSEKDKLLLDRTEQMLPGFDDKNYEDGAKVVDNSKPSPKNSTAEKKEVSSDLLDKSLENKNKKIDPFEEKTVMVGNVVKSFKDKKIVDYLKTGQYKKVLVRFHHGLGDTVLFYASRGMDMLREMFPDIEIAFHTALGQEDVFGKVDNDESHYDLVFEPSMPLSEWDVDKAWNKAEKCLHVEFGIECPLGKSQWRLPITVQNRLIGFHFHSTCLKSLCVNEQSALKVWQYVQNKGFVALSTHMRHKNNHTKLFRFESSNIIDEPATVIKLFGVLKACAGFAGTASGNFHSALAILPPEKILFLKTDFDVTRITHLPVRQLDVRDSNKIDFGIIDTWLNDVLGS